MKQTVNNVWDARLYDGSHSFVSKFGHDLVDILAPSTGELILDIGCGTGDLANQIYESGATVIGIDKSENMINEAANKYPHINFFVNDIIELEARNEFDAVFSNAMLHWVKQPKQALQCIFNSLKPNGRFIAELGGKGNIDFITTEMINQLKLAGIEYSAEQLPWFFPSIGEYSTLLEETGFTVHFIQHFDRPTPLIGENGLSNWIDMFGGDIFAGITEHIKVQIISSVEKNLRNVLYRNGQWIADYKRLRVVASKK
ncbi:class I SAM-dependent methyltransferase [Alkalihalobacterium bogoriense]|uniref:class I SAM-dependent methyltransferase n=1 Tax=Alkalihalobacterium bogoriense TaxID=246272 RepID=UPI00047C0CC6|nr:class I SAM-dependent methyltransferase [Alkalihalobacterium bogoriense]